MASVVSCGCGLDEDGDGGDGGDGGNGGDERDEDRDGDGDGGDGENGGDGKDRKNRDRDGGDGVRSGCALATLTRISVYTVVTTLCGGVLEPTDELSTEDELPTSTKLVPSSCRTTTTTVSNKKKNPPQLSNSALTPFTLPLTALVTTLKLEPLLQSRLGKEQLAHCPKHSRSPLVV
ncbi:hypothetical protein EYR41_006702 [Orbilia oligospora]|uniref:Uncharacterized protein n=1 Tax=Orbilia oligospora TaxID=2813651 RepID=A0A8H2DZ16_ORBOL|nr:hypothetical protein EYR41_006702 [Orbilia oligospora]